MRILKKVEEIPRAGKPKAVAGAKINKYTLFLNSSMAEAFKEKAYIWAETDCDLCVAPEVPDYVKDEGYKVYTRAVCKSASYHGGGIIRFLKILKYALPDIVKEKKPIVCQDYDRMTKVFTLKF